LGELYEADFHKTRELWKRASVGDAWDVFHRTPSQTVKTILLTGGIDMRYYGLIRRLNRLQLAQGPTPLVRTSTLTTHHTQKYPSCCASASLSHTVCA